MPRNQGITEPLAEGRRQDGVLTWQPRQEDAGGPTATGHYDFYCPDDQIYQATLNSFHAGLCSNHRAYSGEHPFEVRSLAGDKWTDTSSTTGAGNRAGQVEAGVIQR